MPNPTCQDVNRNCEFTNRQTKQSDIQKEYREVETHRIGYDSVMKREATGNMYREVTTFEQCIHRGKENIIQKERKYV